ncbi:MAG TPA: hypothetical protein ENI55_04750 [Alphaproteobacteria bacterium]|nr:hypothetical protein [Alphaproteobacteria bacterium]
MHIDKLPDNTRGVFLALENDPDIGEFVLIGGSAISLHCGHRRSEDLDFAFAGSRLPRPAVKRIIDRLAGRGFEVGHATDEAAMLYWENEGGDLEEHQQDWTVNGARVTFFAADYSADSHKRGAFIERPAAPVAHVGNIKILDMDGLFEMKSRLLTRRTASRDIFDLWHFLTNEGRTMDEVVAFAREEDKYYTLDMIRHRLLPQAQPKLDSGFEHLNPNGPADFDALKIEMNRIFGEYESRVAKQITIDDLGDDLEGGEGEA